MSPRPSPVKTSMTLCAGDDRATVSTSGRSTPSRCPNKCATRSAGDGRPSMGRSMRSAAKGAASWPVGTKGLVKERHPAGAIPLRIEGVERNGCDCPCFRHVVFRQGMMRIYSVRPCLKGGGKPCIPGRKSRDKPVKYDKRRYKQRSRIEIMFERLKDWRRVATRYDRSPTVPFINRARSNRLVLGIHQ